MFSIKLRLEKVRKLLELIKTDACVVKSYENRLYLTGLKTSSGLVIVTKRGNSYFLVDKRYEEIAQKQLLSQGFKVIIVNNGSEYTKYINEIVQSDRVSSMILESQGISHEDYLSFETALYAKTMPMKSQLNKLRMIKNLDEVENIKAAQRINEKVFNEVINFIKPGMTERQVQAKIVHLMLENGSDLDKFSICCISGKNSSLIHGRASDKVIEKGENVMIEFGAVYNGYRSNMARTIFFGKPSDEFLKAYDVVKNSFVIAMQHLKNGAAGIDADTAVRNFIESSGFRGCFNHSLGHGIGIDLNESPALSPTSTDILSKGNILAIEPGIYLKENFGIRICDMFYVSDNLVENITRTPKDLIIL